MDTCTLLSIYCVTRSNLPGFPYLRLLSPMLEEGRARMAACGIENPQYP